MSQSLENARASHAQAGYRRYDGPKLSGPRHVIARGTSLYPSQLEDLQRPPAHLYAIGDTIALNGGLAVIGARKATPYGIACTRRFARIAAEQGVTIISGGAIGCDGEAHRAAIEGGAPTVVVMGGGCDFVYPARHFDLFQQVVDKGGIVISEREWEFPALPYCFRERNRIIAALAQATLIVEAGLPSGTFSTADDALEIGRDVLVVPGAITSKTSAGSNRLLYQGATPVVDDDSFGDVLFNIFGRLKVTSIASDSLVFASVDEDPLLASLQAHPMRIDEMRREIPVPPGEDERTWLLVKLAQLEQAGFVSRYPDGKYGPARA